MMNQPMNQQQMMNWINIVSFAVNDITLYLDTHPCDESALDYYRHYHKLRQEALAAYEKAYGPLTLDSYCADGKWQWSTQNPPWKGDVC